MPGFSPLSFAGVESVAHVESLPFPWLPSTQLSPSLPGSLALPLFSSTGSSTARPLFDFSGPFLVSADLPLFDFAFSDFAEFSACGALVACADAPDSVAAMAIDG